MLSTLNILVNTYTHTGSSGYASLHASAPPQRDLQRSCDKTEPMPSQNTKINSKKQLQINRGNTAETMLTKTGEIIKKRQPFGCEKNCRSMFQIDYFICALFSFHLFLCILLLFSRLFFCYTIFNIYVFDVLRINFSFFAQP